MDERFLELADELTDATRTRAIEAAQRAAAPEKHPDFDGEHCVECWHEIPEGRIALGKVRCVRCQTIKERGFAR